MLQSWFDARAVGVSTGDCIMVFEDDGVLPKTKTMARAQYIGTNNGIYRDRG